MTVVPCPPKTSQAQRETWPVHLKTSRNEAADAAFYDSYMLQATFTLPAGACSDVVADRATLAMAGEDRTVAFTVLPGNDGDFTITMKAKDFRLPSAQIVALPYSSVIEMPSAEGMVDGVSQLAGRHLAACERRAAAQGGRLLVLERRGRVRLGIGELRRGP